MSPQSPSQQEHVCALLDKIEDIARMKEDLPLNQRGWCFVLGLYVQKREFSGFTFTKFRIQAGGKFRSFIDARKTIKFGDETIDVGEWDVKKYEPGNWEDLVDPTYDLTYWIYSNGGIYESDKELFDQAVATFKETGNLKLPKLQRPESRLKRDPNARLVGSSESDQMSGTRSGCGSAVLILITILLLIALFQVLAY